MNVSLVIPIRNEEESIEGLIQSIGRQTRQPDEIILVDGGSIDRTIEIVEHFCAGDPRMRLIKIEQGTPGKGRNVGIDNAANDWIALTDAGIILDKGWLEELYKRAGEEPVDLVYGNFTPVVSTFFEKCAYISYAPPKPPEGVRGRSVASMFLKKSVWKKVGGFPDMRAAEDLIFMEAVEAAGFKAAYAPKAMLDWRLQPDLSSTFRKFSLYSKHNVWAGRQWEWHYGIARQYLLPLSFILAAIFHTVLWLIGIPLWLLARTAKRILTHRYEFGWITLFNPLIFFGVAGLITVIDTATFVGWAQAKIRKQ